MAGRAKKGLCPSLLSNLHFSELWGHHRLGSLEQEGVCIQPKPSRKKTLCPTPSQLPQHSASLVVAPTPPSRWVQTPPKPVSPSCPQTWDQADPFSLLPSPSHVPLRVLPALPKAVPMRSLTHVSTFRNLGFSFFPKNFGGLFIAMQGESIPLPSSILPPPSPPRRSGPVPAREVKAG